MNRKINIILIAILIGVSAWSLYARNLYILVANICVISAVFMDEHTGKMLMKENVNIKLIKNIKKLIPILYVIGAIALIIWGYSRYLK